MSTGASLTGSNEKTSVDFWALEIEFWRIGDSPVAPKFKVVCESNELDGGGGGVLRDLTDTKLLPPDFWKGLSGHLVTSGS